jgi:hypothetical protein
MFKFFTKRRNLNFLAILIVIFAVGLYIGYSQNKSIASIIDKNPETVDMTSFWKTWGIIDEKYPNQIDIMTKREFMEQ